MKRRYDRRADKDGFQLGDAVWLYNPRVKRNISSKLAWPWDGPYRVMEKLTDVVYRIQQSPRSKSKVVNRYRLWRVQGQLPDNWWETTAVTSNATEDPRGTLGLHQPVQPGGPVESEEELDVEDEVHEDTQTRSGRTVRRPHRYLN